MGITVRNGHGGKLVCVTAAIVLLGAGSGVRAQAGTALQSTGGLVNLSAAIHAALDAEKDGTSSGVIDIRDAVRLARQASGLDPVGSASLSLTLADAVVGRGAAISPTVVARDGAGNVQTPTPPYTLTATPSGTVSGTVVITGGVATFSPDASGTFHIRAALNSNPAVADQQDLIVLGTGEPDISLYLYKYVRDVGSILRAMVAADDANDTAALQTLTNQLNSLRHQPSNRFEMFEVNKVFNPQAGFIPTRAQVVAAGLPASAPDDAEFTAKLIAVQNGLVDVYTKLIAIPDNPGVHDIDAFNAATAALTPLMTAFVSLHPSVASFMDNAAWFNQILWYEFPAVLDATSSKAMALLGSGGIHPNNALGAAIGGALKGLGNPIAAYEGFVKGCLQNAATSAAFCVLSKIINSFAPDGMSLTGVCGASCTIVATDLQAFIFGSGFSYDTSKDFIFAVGPAIVDQVLSVANAASALYNATDDYKLIMAAKNLMNAVDGLAGDKVGSYQADVVDSDPITGDQYMYLGNGFKQALIAGQRLGFGTVLLIVKNLENDRFYTVPFTLSEHG